MLTTSAGTVVRDYVVLPWFALKVSVRSESLATTALRNRGYEVFSPTYSENRNYSDRIKVVKTPAFPGYVLVRWDGVNKTGILRCPAVKSFICFGGPPEAIPEKTVSAVRRILQNGGQSVPYLAAGDRVRVDTGVLSGIEGIYLRRARGGDLIVSIDIIRRSVALHVAADHVELLRKACA